MNARIAHQPRRNECMTVKKEKGSGLSICASSFQSSTVKRT
jgi:hypothetical protein